MKRSLRGFAAAGSLFLAMFVAEAAFAQKQGGILKMYDPDSPASMSIHEEAHRLRAADDGSFNNLVMFDEHVEQNSLELIVPDLATGWSWNEDGTEFYATAAPRHHVARRQALHGQGRPVHLGSADRQGEREASRQSPQVLVSEPSVLSLKWSSKSRHTNDIMGVPIGGNW